jgi:hypothetical protein
MQHMFSALAAQAQMRHVQNAEVEIDDEVVLVGAALHSDDSDTTETSSDDVTRPLTTEEKVSANQNNEGQPEKGPWSPCEEVKQQLLMCHPCAPSYLKLNNQYVSLI